MAGRIILILFVFSINLNTFVSGDDTSCVPDLPSLIAAFSSNETSTDNILKIHQTFYPQNKPAPHFVLVHYYYDEFYNNSDTANYTYIWTDNPIFLVVDYYLLSVLTFKLAGLGDIGEQSFVVSEPCNNNTNKELLLALTTQLKSIGGTDKGFYFAHHFDVNKQNDYPVDDYDGAKIVIFLFLFFTTTCCIAAVHLLMFFEKTRIFLGKFLKKIEQKYTKTNREEHPLIPNSRNINEVTLFFFIKRVIFPVVATAVVGLTVADICFFSIAKKNHKTSSDIDNYAIFFPFPFVAPFFISMNTLLTCILHCKSKYRYKLKQCSCECFLITLTLLLLFGIVYPVYHGFWIVIALIAYPGRVLISGVFIVPFFLAIILTWNLLIKVLENCYRCCKGEEMSFLFGFIWFVLLLVNLIFWLLFIGTLIYISTFLLGSSVNLETNKFQSLVYFIVSNAAAALFTWLNAEVAKHIKKNHQNNQSQVIQDDQETFVLATMKINTK